MNLDWLIELLQGLVLDHHSFANISMWYGAATLITGLLLLILPKGIRRYSHYIRLIHLAFGAIAATLGLITYLISPG